MELIFIDVLGRYCHSRESGNPEVEACHLDFRFRGNDEVNRQCKYSIYLIVTTHQIRLLYKNRRSNHRDLTNQ